MTRKWRRRLQKLFSAQTWLNPKNLFYLLLIWVLGLAAHFITKYYELRLENSAKTARISVSYESMTVLTLGELDKFAQAHGCEAFHRRLDEGIYDTYVVAPFRIKNPTQNPIEKAAFEIDLGCSVAKILDIRWAVHAPTGKAFRITTDLPPLKWVFPTPPTNSCLGKTFRWSPPSELPMSIYCSLAEDRGFGNVLLVDAGASGATIPIVPTTEVKNYYVFATFPKPEDGEETAVIGSRTNSGPPVGVAFPNPLYLFPAYEPSESQGRSTTQLQSTNWPFMQGHATITFESGIDPMSDVTIYVLAKMPPGGSMLARLTMTALPAIGFYQANPPIPFTLPDRETLDPAKRLLMPLMASALVAPGRVLIYWSPPQATNYVGVKIFRSDLRAFGDYSKVGQKIYEGSGETSSFEIIRRFDLVSEPVDKPNSHLNAPPADPPPPGVPAAPPAPRGYFILTNGCPDTAHFIDSSLPRAALFTYTLYAYDRNGLCSYPVIVNAAVDGSSNYLSFHASN